MLLYDAIIVDAMVNNRKVSLMFDTGFSGCAVVDQSINIGKPTGYMTLRDFVGTLQAPTVKVTSLKLGEKTIDPTDMEAVQQPARGYSFSYNRHCDGIMGFEVIYKYVVEINFEKKRFIFYPKTHDITKRTPDNQKTFLAKLLPTGNRAMEMEVVASTGKKMILALDTGNAFYSTTHKDVLERIGLWDAAKKPKFMRSAFVASGEVASWTKKMENLTIYGVPVKESYWSIIDAPSSSAEGDGTVGFGFLKNFNITVDYERRRVWLENFTGKAGSEPVGDLGISAFWDDNKQRARVGRVAPDSPADKAGVKVADDILSVDGNEVLNTGPKNLIRMFEGPKGEKVKLVLSRNGQLIRTEIAREYLHNVYP